MKIGTKLNLLLMLVFVSTVLISGAALSSVLEQNAQEQVRSKALTLMQLVISTRDYTNNQVTPLLTPMLETNKKFIPQSVPNFAAREIFENLRIHNDYSNFFYKDATLDPTNLRDKADEFETNLIERSRKESGLQSLAGWRTLFGDNLFYSAQPFVVTEQSCLRCHSTPEAAPKSQLASYGPKNGFGWKLNDIIGIQIIYVPAQKVFDSAHHVLSVVMGILVIVFATVILLMNFLLRRTVLQPIRKMAKIADKVSTGDMSSDFEKPSNDEIGALAVAFNRMKTSFEIALNMLNQHNK